MSAEMLISIILAVIALLLGLLIGNWLQKRSHQNTLNQAHDSAAGIIETANKEAETLKKEKLVEAREESHQYRTQVENELKERRHEVQQSEHRVLQREEALDHRDDTLDRKEQSLSDREGHLNDRQQQLDEREQDITSTIAKQQAELERIASLTKDQARDQILTATKAELAHERAKLIKESEDEAHETADRTAKSLIADAIQRSASDVVAETTVTTVTLPNDDMKGRIIGREGRNIRTLETLTGIDLIIDDTPEAVVLSGFDPIRREIARMALEKLIQDGRIHPARIEEMVDKARKEMDERIREVGEQAIFDVGIHNMHPDLIKILGRLHFRTSYGQNVLDHSIQVAKLAGIMAAELGEDVNLARRAGLLHDIGKAQDREVGGSHVEIGVELATKYKEPQVVINTIASHHGDVAPTSVIAVLVAAADAISAARPGARSESLENYLHRLEKLESIANSFTGVDHSYAIQAGREVRVIVQPEALSDEQSVVLARDIRNRIEKELEYPGHIKVTVIREKRTVEYAK
ncbi:MAG: ribonuclease Y [Lactobacillus sp.]|jgi:ribonuclease Y|uniref:Ribonuclease Y n=1 Tax=Lacticaseibacillus suilingensis TaxID=2799577 RepID=A0ABW4BD82_9LACO|nr:MULTISPECIES: ribonuclease Y [Lacticaseibacillus]MCI1893601.1 ribonuclease Y [Lactobacillus sp.]MCI1918321.1 ribonuclease Y [Lactobacillus sp.]MCI1941233.1 ribonuclease Y [Lactobacillus sp.]MCI1971777.1 ribonuclease Y [Lactobacillus sp.]MCI2016217.1 ribonuclease Y [Lactobacillus sp.]